ncbi:hypothetical protein [Kitasatospora sp. NPDC097643]|uniref:hypothetical protein n=1 Tax=Kitasatospora sp. NPDC097643 TaxID=3157230 RepID=UPI003332A3D3
MRTVVKAAVTTAVAGVLALGLTGTASAATGPANLTGLGCPGSYTNNNSANGGATGWTQYLQYTYTGGNGFRYGHYTVYYWSVNGSSSYQGTNDYRCY